MTQKRELPVGTVLRAGDPEPPEGTPLLDQAGHCNRYRRMTSAGMNFSVWSRFVEAVGPFVVAPDYDKLVSERRKWSQRLSPRDDRLPPGVEDEFGLTEHDLLGLMY